jgi:nucleoid-associated protein YgaU
MSASGPGGGPPKKPKADFSNVQSSHGSTAPAPPPVSAPPAEKVHVVAKGESLSKIAQKYYGKASLWTKIHEANKDQIKNPDLIKPGQKLRIPAL